MFGRACVIVVSTIAVITCVSGLAGAATPSIKVMTYNTNNGGAPQGQLDTIAAQTPDVVVLQEARYDQLATYVDGLNSRLGTTAWHGQYARHCSYGTAPTCAGYYDGTVMVLTRLRTLSVHTTLIWAADDYVVARGTIHMQVALADGTPVNVFVCHLPAVVGGSFDNATSARDAYVAAFKKWAQSFPGTQLVGGDFNAHPTNTPILDMEQQFVDAWATGGTGGGYTHTNPTVTTRLDYWFNNATGSAKLTAVSVVPDTIHSDHRPVVASYDIPSSTSVTVTTTGEQTLLTDNFTTLDRTAWPASLFTGSQDTTIPITVSGGAVQIGALKASTTGVHYNGITSGVYNITTNGYASVQLIQVPNIASTAYAMFAVGSDGEDFYRWYEVGNTLVAEKKIAGIKTVLADLAYSATDQQFLRIRRDYNASVGVNDVVFETAPNNNGTPGTFVERHREAWDTHIVAAGVRFELEAGTSEATIDPGSARWGRFHAATNFQP